MRLNLTALGIGLIIIKTLIKQMAGAIEFDSEEGQGSTFWVEFEQV